MERIRKSLLPVLIATALTAPAAWAQDDECIDLEGAPPGLYTSTDQGVVLLIKDDQVVELEAGESGFADEENVTCINKPPAFMDWPCSTQAAQSRKFATYRWEDLTGTNGGVAQEVVQRYFEVPEVVEPIPNWLEGQYHAVFNLDDLIQFTTPEYWYSMAPEQEVLNEKRPKILLISLFVGLNKVVIDNNLVSALQKHYGEEPIPTAFIFNDSNVVPVSYFGDNVSLEEILEANQKRGIKLQEPPMWWLGDYSLMATTAELDKFFEIPPLEDISAEKQAEIRADLEAFGFSRKPVFVNLFADSGTMALDQPARVRVAMNMGIDRIPVAVFTIEPDIILARCGPGTPVGTSAAAISGETTPIGGATVPPGTVNPPEPPASDSQ